MLLHINPELTSFLLFFRWREPLLARSDPTVRIYDTPSRRLANEKRELHYVISY